MEHPTGETIKIDEFIRGVDIGESLQVHVQLECPDSERILGYLGVGGATGGDDFRGYQ
jgi:hypothetical protein